VATGREAAAFDQFAHQKCGVPEPALMESAGRAAAEVGHALAPEGPVVVLAGAGHNGGDALVAARTLRAWGRSVSVLAPLPRDPADPLLHGWTLPWIEPGLKSEPEPEPGPEPSPALEPHLALEPNPALELGGDLAPAARAALASAALVIDGLLGTGLRGIPRPATARLIAALDACPATVLALDVPSGVDADTGAVPGAAVRATATVAFGWPKLGTLIGAGRSHTGRLIVAEIGFPPAGDAFAARLLTPAWARSVRPRRAADTHKNAVGALTLVAGGEGMAGAAVLAGRAALRSGAGYLRLVSAPAHRDLIQAALPDAVFVDWSDGAAVGDALEAAHAVAIGPGLGQTPAALGVLEHTLATSPSPLVVDADALNLLAAGRPRAIEALGTSRPVVLTPHPGEAARLLGSSAEDVQRDRPAAARALAERSAAVCVLKGMPSLVADPTGHLDVAGPGSSDLAVAGMGDVLTGSIGALLAQGLPPRDASGLALLAGAAAVAATGYGPGLAASDVPDHLPAALEHLGAADPPRAFAWALLDLPAPR
jgi:NAD(P)H-hydrate epimerase